MGRRCPALLLRPKGRRLRPLLLLLRWGCGEAGEHGQDPPWEEAAEEGPPLVLVVPGHEQGLELCVGQVVVQPRLHDVRREVAVEVVDDDHHGDVRWKEEGKGRRVRLGSLLGMEPPPPRRIGLVRWQAGRSIDERQ